MSGIGQDLGYALRGLRRKPGFTTVAILVLALGIGANVTMFTFVDVMLFKPSPWSHDGRLVWLTSSTGRSSGSGSMSHPDYVTIRDRASTFAGILAYSGGSVSVGSATPQRALAGVVSANYFDTVGIRAARGRTFTEEEERPGAQAVVVLSDEFWRTQFGAAPAILNTSVTINGTSFTIIGVAPPGFTGITYATNPERLWVPLGMQSLVMRAQADLLSASDVSWLRVVGRLRHDTTMSQADAEVRVLARRLNAPGIPPDREKTVQVVPLRGGLTAGEQASLAPVFGLMSVVPMLVLLVACANVANGLMARHVARAKEFALRVSIGATRARLVRQLMAEAFVMALCSAAAGFVMSFLLIAAITRYGEVPADVVELVRPDRRALIAAVIAATATTFIFGLAPALTATRVGLLQALKQEGLTATPTTGRRRLVRGFVVAQVALSLALLVTSGLFFQSLSKAMRVDPGFDPRGVVIASFDPDPQGYTVSRREQLIRGFAERGSALPGVISVAFTSARPLSGDMPGTTAHTESTSAPVVFTRISPSYFDTLRLPLVQGREFSLTDSINAPPVAIVNETLARRLWSSANPIGQRLRDANASQVWREVVGVVRDAKYQTLTERPVGAYYLPLLQDDPGGTLSLLVRSNGDEREMFTSLTAVARSLDPALPLFDMQTLQEDVRRTTRLRRTGTSLLTVFGGMALLLAAVGIYAVAAHAVSLRTREVGIRMAFGAQPNDVSRMFVVESVTVALIGVLIGLGLSAGASQVLTTFLFGLTGTDAMTFMTGSVVVIAVVILASYIPARRASRVDPLVALRYE